MKKGYKKLICCISFALLLTACSGNSNKSSNEQTDFGIKKLSLTYVTSPLNVPSIVDKNKQIVKDSFPGVDVSYAEITSGSDQTQALASGDVQILHAVGASSVISAAAAGADIKIINMYSRGPKAYALYTKNASIKSAKDLKGKKIGGPIGTNLHELLVSYLQKADMSIKDVDFLNMQIPDALSALEGGSIDVALLAGASTVNADKAGYHKVTDGEGLLGGNICVATTKKFYDEHKNVIDQFMTAQQKMRTFMKDNANDTKEMVKKELSIDDDAYTKMFAQYDFDLKIKDEDMKEMQNTADFMYNNKMIKQKVDVSSLMIQK